jgi:catechol 2,3-dioxygenase-like lactoylglutathione lyase family enzyme
MKRFHVHVAVPDLEKGIHFYSTVFGAEPSVVKPDYAKWMLEDPRVNFAISQRGNAAGVNHLGFQVDDAGELDEIHGRLQRADAGVVEEKGVSCCYAKSDKYWVTDPAGIAWETFRSLGTVPFYKGNVETEGKAAACGGATVACCAPGEQGTGEAACCN